ncbi:hypothetical protein AHiyo4_49630 [Arthrobacter sp. Hiyo4]|nr:hypothetical protein AHiyo4_49630 [Arthrobacter sp. Hiyo4]
MAAYYVDHEAHISAAVAVAALAGSIGLATAGVSVPICLIVVVLALGVSIVIDEKHGTERMNAALEQLKAGA